MTKPVPEKLDFPDLVVRVGFAGTRTLPENNQPVVQALDFVFQVIVRQLQKSSLSVAENQTGKSNQSVARFYRKNLPTLRLITGLAEGSDALAADALDRIDLLRVKTELAAVLPFGINEYRDSRNAGFHSRFDSDLERCSYVLALDGNCRSGDEGQPVRARAYRAQATMLLRHCDILLAVTDLNEPTRFGGTTETIKAALNCELPVIFVDARNGRICLIDAGADISSALLEDSEHFTNAIDLESQLSGWIMNILTDPDLSGSGNQLTGILNERHDLFGEALLQEFFRICPNSQRGNRRVERPTVRKRLWDKFESSFRPVSSRMSMEWKLPSLEKYRDRSAQLNYHYAGLYRGAFVLNYLLAVTAVFLAALSLVLLQQADNAGLDPNHTAVEKGHVALVPGSNEPDMDGTHNKTGLSKHLSGPMLILLLVLGGMKLGIVIFILRNTHRANHEDWNDKAIDFRYLAERLRTMAYQARTGSFQPPVISRPQYASRVARQSAVEWLFRALARATAPEDLAMRTTVDIGNGKSLSVALIRLDAKTTLAKIIEFWIAGQCQYHDGIAVTMSRMYRVTEKWGRWLTWTVIGAVGFDVLILATELFDVLPSAWESRFSIATPWLVFLAALLPAAVASLNGIRFQSECRRLADRSAVVRLILGGYEDSVNSGGWMREANRLLERIVRAEMEPENNPGSWDVEVMRLCEQIAADLTQEVAEWSVLYAKEVSEP